MVTRSDIISYISLFIHYGQLFCSESLHNISPLVNLSFSSVQWCIVGINGHTSGHIPLNITLIMDFLVKRGVVNSLTIYFIHNSLPLYVHYISGLQI